MHPTPIRFLSRHRFMRACLLLCAIITTTFPALAGISYKGPVPAGKLQAPPKQESSGLAVSRHLSDILWLHDDSGGAPVLYAIDTTGAKRGSLRVAGVKNEDWEDVASFKRDGKAWLLIADTGDNDAERDSVLVHVLEEPSPLLLSPSRESSARPAYSLRIRYEDGPRDCEGVAVDANEGAIYLLTKRDSPPRLYRVPLGPTQEKQVTARRVGNVPELAGDTPINSLFKRVAGKRAAWPTSFDISADATRAVVLTYAGPVVYLRKGKEPWSEVLQREPARLVFPGMSQAEGVTFSADGDAIYVVSESTEMFVRYDSDQEAGKP